MDLNREGEQAWLALSRVFWWGSVIPPVLPTLLYSSAYVPMIAWYATFMWSLPAYP